MTMAENKEMLVFADWAKLKQPALMGQLYVSRLRGNELFQFEYDPKWLQSEHAMQVDPELILFSGRQYPAGDRRNFGVFLDSMPDRWGRQLMMRREAITARRQNRNVRLLSDSDFLLGVYDLQRSGALRFQLSGEGRFLNDDKLLAVPPWSSLRELEYASMVFEQESDEDENLVSQWINTILAPGSSLGGARPKAGIIDQDGQLWIAKFPSRNDDVDTGAWEFIVNSIGQIAGLNMAVGKVVRLKSAYHTYLSKRFDRIKTGARIHFTSAMTMLQRKDGDDFTTGVSYLELVEFIMRHCVKPEHDLKELWLRIVFSILVKNTDDHLRNHGFILTSGGWELSPAYDINPNPHGNGLRLNISENDNSLDVELALSVAPLFRLNYKEAKEMANKISGAVSSWQKLAIDLKIPRLEQELMKAAFSG